MLLFGNYELNFPVRYINDCLHIFKQPTQILVCFIHMEKSPLSVKDSMISALIRFFWPLSRGGSLSCHTCCDMYRALVFAASSEAICPILSPCTKTRGTEDLYILTWIQARSDENKISFRYSILVNWFAQ